MPTRMVPTAPIPVHTAYAVPKGSDRSASDIKAKLSAIATMVAMVGQNLVSPSEYFSPSAQATSNSPAARSAAQALILFLAPAQVRPDIPLRLEYPKIGRIDDAEIVADRIAEDGPVFRHLLAQETQNGITEVVVGRVAPIVRHVSMHQPP